MRIVGGALRGRRLEAPPGGATRPTADRVREALFNILEHAGWRAGGLSILRGAEVLDAFCGTGALGLEALSRGAAHATFVEHDRAVLPVLRRNIAAFGVAERSSIFAFDATQPPQRPAERPAAALVFLDPPYREDLAAAALAALAKRGWIAEGAVISIEHAASAAPPATGAEFVTLDHRRYGRAAILLLRYAPRGTAG
jgi:16S rRNA (guanine966-N2)-methyltransferase